MQIFLCNASGDLLQKSNEAKNIRWMSLMELKSLLESNKNSFYPMHVKTFRKIFKYKINM